MSYVEIARKVGLPEKRIRSIIRCSIFSGIFTEPFSNQVAYTPASAILACNPATRALYDHFLNDSFQVTPKLVDALKRNPVSISPSETAFKIAFDAEGTVFDYFAVHSESQKMFSKRCKVPAIS